ncbi:MAG: ABC transporter substrate-binding protein [Labilithrix sp.]|nr:ABC transporter substrate-binding protein [Labilithrix sp.]
MAALSDVGKRGLVALFTAALASSCSLTTTTVDKCSKNADCRTAFGGGRVCAADGLCESAPVNPRCTAAFPDDVLTRPESYPNAILIGALFDRNVESHRARENAIRLAVRQVNEANGLDGRLFGVVLCDIAEDAKYDSAKRTDAAVASAKYLADVVGVPAIVGPSASTDVLPVFEAIKDLDVLLISPAATSPALTGADTKTPTNEAPGLLWRTAPPDTLQGAAIERHLRDAFPTANTIALVQEKGAYGDALAAVFTEKFQVEGRSVRPFVFANTSARDAAVQDAGAEGLPVVLFISSQTSDAIAFLNSANTLASYATTRLFLTDAAANTDLLKGASGASAAFPRVIGSRPAVPQGPTYELFRTSFTAAFRQDPNTFSFVPHTYDAAWLTFYGSARSLRVEKKITGTGIARGLRLISAGGAEIPIRPDNWTRIADALSGAAAVNLTGTSGPLDYDPVTEETAASVDIWKISADGTKIETVTTIDTR